ncbi:MAG TPA: type II toxin-antitoxin system VapC family toxin [Candidatus Sulfotelmatobacter sp.]|nr:type II toxin-antitoxin system VapC family toxin [Candidatus Sulfotelmatobacter sp.]
MNLLLDTHIWIWSKLEPDRIRKQVARELSASGNELWLSPISVWEALTLMHKGRVQVNDPLAWVQRAAEQMREAPLTQEIVRTSFALSLSHADPAGRFLAATAKVLKLTLVTADQRLLGLAEISSLANR